VEQLVDYSVMTGVDILCYFCCLNLYILDRMDGVKYYLANLTVSSTDSGITVDSLA